jgi:hypothetical protein
MTFMTASCMRGPHEPAPTLHNAEHRITDDFGMARLRGAPADQRELAVRDVPDGELAQRAPDRPVVPVLLAQPRAVLRHDVVP